MEDFDGFNHIYQALMEYYRLPPETAAKQLSAILRQVDAVRSAASARTVALRTAAGGSVYG